MSTVTTALIQQFRRLGYAPGALVRDYNFPDVLTSGAPRREVTLAAFTDTPTSYRNAAFGVLTNCMDASQQIRAHQALGAQIWLCISGDQIEVWNVRGPNGPVRETTQPLTELEALFDAHHATWAPDRIHNAKVSGLWDTHAQMDLLGAGLLKDIEAHTQEQLDRIITRTLRTLASENASVAEYRRAYRACFYFVAAKIVLDRRHPVGKQWPADDAQGILEVVSRHYQLSYAAEPGKGIRRQLLEKAWTALRDDVSFANVSADDLAFVYENTLVSPETRKELGTHSTPRAVAEFLVSRLELGRYGQNVPRIYEPFCGAGVLLVAALSAVRRNLPRDWTEAQRHAFLVRRLRGRDVDAFACEVASLSLILADYPSSNGWDIRHGDLFEPGALAGQLDPGAIVLCNPPFEDFELKERVRYPEASAISVHKPDFVLNTILDTNPAAVGFVMPSAILSDSKYDALRRRLEGRFRSIDTVSLPDKVFVEADFESALLIAQDPRPHKQPAAITKRSATVSDATRKDFLAGTYRPIFRTRVSHYSEAAGQEGKLWVPELAELWDYLAHYPTLNSVAKLHRGIEWQPGHQSQATSRSRRAGFRPGLHSPRELCQFAHSDSVYLDCRQQNLRGNAIDLPWDEPKVLVNAVRKSRGAWRLAASLDRAGLVASQQLVGCWSRDGAKWLPVIEALLNSPLASAFIGIHDPRQRFRLEVLRSLPIPRTLSTDAWRPLIERVRKLVTPAAFLASDQELTAALLQLDAAVLRTYELPPRLESMLLAYFEDSERPACGTFLGYPSGASYAMARSLGERLAGRFDAERGGWVGEVFTPLPADERKLVSGFIR